MGFNYRVQEACFIFYYSNFDKHHYKYFHLTECTEPTPLVLNYFDVVLQIERN